MANAPSQEAMEELQQRLAEQERVLAQKEAELEEARRETEYVSEKLVSMGVGGARLVTFSFSAMCIGSGFKRLFSLGGGRGGE